MAKQALTVRIHLSGVDETLAAFRRLPKEASRQLRERSLELSETLARKVRTAAQSDSGQSALMAPTVKARRDRVPSIQAGGSARVGRNRVPAYKVLFGSEFGATILPQFRPHLGRGSYWFYKTVESENATIDQAWNQAADAIVADFSRGGVLPAFKELTGRL